MDTLSHNGVLVLEPPELRPFTITVRGSFRELTPLQSEMAVAWVRKLGTPYAEDPVFKENFMADFSKAIDITPVLEEPEIDFTPVIRYVEAERARKEAMTKEEKKEAREQRKASREQLKEKYGFAIADGERMELGQYQTEPSGIFMGRGKHPLRGRWKQGATYKDITLNLSPDARVPSGDWGNVIWAPDCMWIAKWTDELTGKTKYLWFHDSTPIKQEREAKKFNKALKVEQRLDAIRAHIMEGIKSDEAKTRAVAAACYLIDSLSLRVGDEKDPEEADTVGATTLRVEHLEMRNGSIVFDFLGKDSVPWHKELVMEPDVYKVFEELYQKASDRVDSFNQRKTKRTRADPKKIAQIFPSINSTHVNRFFSEAVPGLTAKMFRTHHASVVMREELKKSKARKVDPEFIKKEAVKRANLEVARVMNHTKQAPKGWPKSEDRYKERIKRAGKAIDKKRDAVLAKRGRLRVLRKREKKRQRDLHEVVQKKKSLVEKYWQSVLSWREKRNRAKTAWDKARAKKSRIRGSRRKGKTTKKERLEDAQESITRTRERLDKAEKGLQSARTRYEKSKASLEKKQQSVSSFKEKSAERITRAERAVGVAEERVKRAEIAKRKIESDYALAKATRTWNLGTSLKSYIHPKVVYNWCQKVDYNWRKVYTSALQRKFAWIDPDTASV